MNKKLGILGLLLIGAMAAGHAAVAQESEQQRRSDKKRQRTANPRRRNDAQKRGDQRRPVNVPQTVELRRDVIFGKGGGRDLKCNLFLPKKGTAPRPAIVFIHGGGWRGGSRGQFQRQAAYLADKGYVGVCIEYRLSGEAKYPAAVEDCKCAVRWLRANAKKFNVDPDRIASCGGSAGGHLAAMLAVVEPSAGLEGEGGHAEFSGKVNLAVVFNGVSDMVIRTSEGRPRSSIEQFLGGTPEEIPERYKEASPITHADKSDPPFLFLHGTKDAIVPYEQSERMGAALRSVGVTAEIYRADDAGHGFFNRPPHYKPTLQRMERFLDEHFRGKASKNAKADSSK